MTQAPLWGVTNLTVRISGTPVLNNVDLELHPGELVALVGPSGAGKTTLLRVLAGIIRPDAGTVTLAGEVSPWLMSREERSRRVGMMQQRLDLVDSLSVRHNVQAGLLGRWGLIRSLAALYLPFESHDARKIVAGLGLEERLGDRVASLSGGEQQRVALARLLVQAPDLCLADEPVASLDPAMADQVLSLLADTVVQQHRIVVASLHDPAMARNHFMRVVGVRDGRIRFDVPSHGLTADLLDSLYRLDSRGSESPKA